MESGAVFSERDRERERGREREGEREIGRDREREKEERQPVWLGAFDQRSLFLDEFRFS